jgi:hypothetical protein
MFKRPVNFARVQFLVSKAGRAAGPHARPWKHRNRKTPVPARTVLGEPTHTAATCGTESKS